MNTAKELFETCDSPKLNLILWTEKKTTRVDECIQTLLQVWKWLTDHRETRVMWLRAQQSACFPTQIYTEDAEEQTNENARGIQGVNCPCLDAVLVIKK